MRNLFFKLGLTLVLLSSIAGCKESVSNSESIKGSGNVVTVEEEYTDFSNIEIGYAFKANIIQGNEYRIVLRIDDNIVEYLEVSKEGSTLKIFLESGNSYDDVTLEADITLPDLVRVNFSGAVSASISGFDFEHTFNASLSGASTLTSNIRTGNVALGLSGASRVTLNGSGGDILGEASGASNLSLGNFTTGDADIHLSGASTGTINADGLLNAYLSGASSLFYYGSPTMGEISISGASTIQGLN
ncbi:MAG: DUF2807 domain-containing protein [Melioribacteraceae bacterium]|nr:DUF2807 domain-containing protein [Melioribacteraceae bacterium]